LFFYYFWHVEEKMATYLVEIFNLFMQNGIRSMTMDDVAKNLNVSKKTLYRHFKDKNDLVQKVMGFHIESDIALVESIAGSFDNAIEEMFKITEHITTQIKEIHPSNLFDLQKYYPEAWGLFVRHKSTFIYTTITNNMKRGIEELLYIPNLNIEIIGRIYIGRIDMCLDATLFPHKDFPFKTVVYEMLLYHLRAVSSPNGMNYLLKKLKSDNS
jgi:TetR/AcrR family transcriptional regulator, cholesterol catabolism regulator